MIESWKNNDAPELTCILNHKVEKLNNKKKGKQIVFLVECSLDDDESGASSLRNQIEQDGGLWTASEALIKDAPVLMGRYIVKNNLTKSSQEWKNVWNALKKMKSMKKTKKAPPKKVPSTVFVSVSPEKKCKHCEAWVHYKPEENAEFFGKHGSLRGVKCLGCNSDMYNNEKCRPTSKNPARTCPGRESLQCMSCYCGTCYKDKLLSDTNSSSRIKRRKLN